MALRARKLSGAFEKRAPGLEPGALDPETMALTVRPPRLPLILQIVHQQMQHNCLKVNHFIATTSPPHLSRHHTRRGPSLNIDPDLLGNRAMFVGCHALVITRVRDNSTRNSQFQARQRQVQVIHIVNSETFRGRKRACVIIFFF